MTYRCPKCKSVEVSFEICTHSMVSPNAQDSNGDYHRQIIDGVHEVMAASCNVCGHQEYNEDNWKELNQ